MGKPFLTVAKCESYGIDCTEDCASTAPAHRRHMQGAGASAAVQVKAGKQSSAQLTTVLDCLANGGNATKCATQVPTRG